MRSFSAYYAAICALFLLFASQHVQAQDVDSLYAVFSASRGQARIGAANEFVITAAYRLKTGNGQVM